MVATRPDADLTAATPPDGQFMAGLAASTAAAAAAAVPTTSAFSGASEELVAREEEALKAVGDQAVALSRDLHAHPEEGFVEHRSVAAVADLVRAHGAQADVGVHGLDTAVRAGHGDGAEAGPTIAIVAEYDALPGIGHGCGHNIICASAVGAFLALAPLAAELPGRVVLLGTPAEEGGGGKEVMARQGAFDDIDAAVMLHPFSHDVAEHPFLGRRQLEITFHGVAAHASAQPFMGRNALDAATLCYTGIAMLRQHLPPSDRVHGVVTDGGQRPNVVPEVAGAQYYLRSADPATLADLCARVTDIARGAALMTGCGVELEWDAQPAYLPIRVNQALAARWSVHQADRGRTALPRGVVPELLAGSSDMGNVSYRVPSIHPMIGLGQADAALHTTGFAALSGSPAGDEAVLDGASGLARTALDYLVDDALRAEVHDEFARAGGPLDVPRFFD